MFYYLSNRGQFVLSFIKEPGLKLFFCSIDTNSVKCTDNIDSCSRYNSVEFCCTLCDSLKDNYGLDFTIERIKDIKENK